MLRTLAPLTLGVRLFANAHHCGSTLNFYSIMRSVHQVLAEAPDILSTSELIVEGFLIVTKQLTVLTPSDQDRQTGIIIPTPGIVEQWIKLIPAFGGSRVCFAGTAKVYAKFCASGIQPLPLIAVNLRRVEFIDAHGIEATYEPPQ